MIELVIKIASVARSTAEIPNEPLLAELRTLEKKMGLVLTLVNISFHNKYVDLTMNFQFKASVWAVIVDSQAAAEAAEQALVAQEKPEVGQGSFERQQGRYWEGDDNSVVDDRY